MVDQYYYDAVDHWRNWDRMLVQAYEALPVLPATPFFNETVPFRLRWAFYPTGLAANKALACSHAARALYIMIRFCKTDIMATKQYIEQSNPGVKNGKWVVESFGVGLRNTHKQVETLLDILMDPTPPTSIALPINWMSCFDNQLCDATTESEAFGFQSLTLKVELSAPKPGVDISANAIRWLVFTYIASLYNAWRPDYPTQRTSCSPINQFIYCHDFVDPDGGDPDYVPLEHVVWVPPKFPADVSAQIAPGQPIPLIHAGGWPYCTENNWFPAGAGGGFIPGKATGIASFNSWLTRGSCHVVVRKEERTAWAGFGLSSDLASRQRYFQRVISAGREIVNLWTVPSGVGESESDAAVGVDLAQFSQCYQKQSVGNRSCAQPLVDCPCAPE